MSLVFLFCFLSPLYEATIRGLDHVYSHDIAMEVDPSTLHDRIFAEVITNGDGA